MKRAWIGFLVAGLMGCSSSSDGSRESGVGGITGDGDDDSTGQDGSGGSIDDGSSGEDDGSSGNGDGNNDGVCEEQGVRSERVTPDMLIVLDRSGSMDPGSNGGVDRWGGSVDGIKAITAALDQQVNFGLLTFPSDDSCGAGALDVPIARGNSGPIAQALDGMAPDGSTPTRVSLEAARSELNAIVPGPDEVARPKYILLVTDGAPNCEAGGVPMLPDLSVCGSPLDPGYFQCVLDLTQQAANSVDDAAVDASVDAIRALAGDGIKTYVIGYSTKNVMNLAAALDKMAGAGDTGDTQHRAVEDQAGLVQEFEEITGAAVSCEFVLDTAPSDPSYVLVTLDGEQLNLNDADGWIISEDRKKVTVQGKACADLQTGVKMKISVKVLCEVVVPQ